MSLSLKERTPKLYGYYQSVFPSAKSPESEPNNYYLINANDVKRLKELEEENIKLKKTFAEVSLENHAMKELFAKKGW